ncbi:c-di-GMP phosphodiesterase [Paenibacillus sp. J31TS4]|uniref:HD-GYP domain-containing protein n=1 Tax=Paenibacillus sp. J31TS4 TaxID=2807195 RepID=UPI001B1FD821|nr:HD domain-containing phosphohydrolase [Paenibacillus sp. J31TS4]GIP41077.1 c-di-GMP phosphodiesterase [Paenibacillus sp. J31TS4]
MRYIQIDAVEPGQYLGKTIFNGNGTVMLAEGVQLTVFMINTLRRIGVTMLFIQDPGFADLKVEEALTEETKRNVMQRMGETLEAFRSGRELPMRSMSLSMDRLIEELLEKKEIMLQLTDIRTRDNEQYLHALNVCTIAVLMGAQLELTHVQLKELAIGALLHDAGKVEEGHDDEAEDMRKHHTWRGFELLKAKKHFSLLVAHVAFQHHETLDGEGVPRGLGGEQIHLYAKIVAVANTYDNLLNREGEDGRRLLPHEVTEHLMGMAGTKLDRELVIAFLRMISIYPTGISVRLSTKETGVVVGQHRGLPGRPIVRVIQKRDDELEYREVDLARHTTTFIEAVLS